MRFILRNHYLKIRDIRLFKFQVRFILPYCLFMLPSVICFFPAPAVSQSHESIRIGYSSSLFYELNRNDVIAATRVWTQALLNQQDISVIQKPVVFDSTDELREALSSNILDYISLTTVEYAAVRDLLNCETITLSVVSDSVTEEYILLVNNDSGIENLHDLQGKSLHLVKSDRLSLSTVWLDTILLREGLKPAADFFITVKSHKNVGKVILPVFFGQGDACVVTRKMFDTISELNPQISKRLKAIAVSPALIPTFFCFTKNSDEGLREKVSREISNWHLSPVGRQSLIIFKSDGLEVRPISYLESALDLISEHKRLMGEITPDNETLSGADAGHRKKG